MQLSFIVIPEGTGQCGAFFVPGEQSVNDHLVAGVFNLQPKGHMWPGKAMHAAQHKIVN